VPVFLNIGVMMFSLDTHAQLTFNSHNMVYWYHHQSLHCFATSPHVIFKAVVCACRTDELKFGDLIGVDEHGNKYYQNKMYFIGN